jgi:hypothetical protein
MINALQIIVNVPLFTINFPANAKMFYTFIQSIASFNIIPMDTIKEKIFGVKTSAPVSDEFDTMGMLYLSITLDLILIEFRVYLN